MGSRFRAAHSWCDSRWLSLASLFPALLNVSGLLRRDHRKSHEGFADQAPVSVHYFAVHYAGTSSLTQYACIGPDFAMLDRFKKIDLHFDGDDSGPHGSGQEGRESPGRIGQHGQNPAVNNTMNLLVQIEHWHAENRPAALGLLQNKPEVIDGIAMAQTFRSARQCRLT